MKIVILKCCFRRGKYWIFIRTFGRLRFQPWCSHCFLKIYLIFQGFKLLHKMIIKYLNPMTLTVASEDVYMSVLWIVLSVWQSSGHSSTLSQFSDTKLPPLFNSDQKCWVQWPPTHLNCTRLIRICSHFNILQSQEIKMLIMIFYFWYYSWIEN